MGKRSKEESDKKGDGMQRLQGTEQTAAQKNAKHNIYKQDMHKQDIHTDSSSIDRIAYDMLYLASIGINISTKSKPDEKCLEHYRTNEENMKALFCMSARHFIDALVGTTLKQAGVVLPKYWEERMVKAVRKVLLFDAERKKLCAWMDSEHIWYLPLKGIILKDYYPSVGMRQMSDNDILFDADAWERVEKHMISDGYKAEAVGKGNHDVYQKPPVYNFELHRSLYGKGHDESWVEYYSDIKERLILDQPEGMCDTVHSASENDTANQTDSMNSSYGYHMSDEDFYIYITSHAYKHYSGSGTGLRTLLDFYAYLNAKEDTLDFDYIRTECKKLGIDDFEQHNRILCSKVFAPHQTYNQASFEQPLSADEFDMLQYYLSSGVYGTFDRMVANRMKKQKNADGKKKLSKLSYYRHRVFPGMELYGNYPLLVKHRWLIPAYWFYRIVRMLFSRKRRDYMLREVKAVEKVAAQESGKSS